MATCPNHNYPCNCSTTETTTCAPCSSCSPEVDALCVFYTGEPLPAIEAESGQTLHQILQNLENFVFSETEFQANSSDSIVATAGGTKGHSPRYSVRLNSSTQNLLVSTTDGLLVDGGAIGDGKVKVDSGDTKDYLENQIVGTTDVHGIVSLSLQKASGKLFVIPSINIPALITHLKEDHYELLCSIAQGCIPRESTTTTTTVLSTTTTTTPAPTTTTTTTVQSKDFIINNASGHGVPYTVYLADAVSNINYVSNSTTFNNQVTSLTYQGTVNTSRIVVNHDPLVNTKIQVVVNGSTFAVIDSYLGSVSVPNIPARANITVNLLTGTVTTSTSTTSTSSSTTSTTTGSSTTTTSSSSTTTTTTCSCASGFSVTADNSQCYKVDEVAATTPTSPENLVAKANAAWSTYGTWVYQSGWSFDGTGTALQIPTTNNFWKNGAGTGADGNTTDGPMNRTAVWTNTNVVGQHIGFSYCIDIPATKTYYIGMGADNYGLIKLDGVTILQQNESALNSHHGMVGASFKVWHVYPVQMSAGPHIIEVLGVNSGSAAGVGLEIYDVSGYAELAGYTSYPQMGSKLLFSSSTEVGQPVTIGSSGSGYSCPSGYALADCGGAPVCRKITYIPCGAPAPTTSTSTTSTTTMPTFNTYLTFASGVQDTEAGVTGTVGTADGTIAFGFNADNSLTGLPSDMNIYKDGILVMVVSYYSDYNGQQFVYQHTTGSQHLGTFTSGNVNF